ncbi:hypothetical protein C8R42DRAFT_683156 [Lentinula raphanica]|nr:hypothetical protein C8R42DRAFT_683156 [Lentinula raphanica]
MSSSSKDLHLVRYYSKLIETYIQLSLYEEAEAIATRVLAVDPSNLIVRLKRGLSRRRLENLVGALVDFEAVLSIPPKPDTAELLYHDEALRQRDIVVSMLGYTYTHLSLSLPDKLAEYNAPEIPSLSPSPSSGDSTEEHTVPLHILLDEPLPTNCRFYNHLGCRRGKKCLYSHAPDARSIRDDLGKNVCLYHLVGKCKWDFSSCIYSHSKDNLPSEYIIDEDTSKPAWWTDPVRVEAVRELIEKRDARRKKIHEQIERARLRNLEKNGKKKRKKKKNPADKSPAAHDVPLDKKEYANAFSDSLSSTNSNCDETLVFDWESESESEDEVEDGNIDSPTPSDVMSFGTKPWGHEEDKALVVALNNLHT